MNNLKRILSLALASVMLIGMMVVGASAADYPDADEIVNKDAVETLGALGIMNGDERGFRPQDGLTRAEAAKMLTKIHNKGVDVNFGVKDTPTFKDTDGHWAEGIIEYAAAFGIVNGMGNGIFNPGGELTVAQLARMVLNMMGYTEGQTGSDWELKTTVLANNMGLFDGLQGFLPTGKVTRDNAAQILVNAIDKPLANGNVTTEDVYTLTGKDEKGAAIKLDFDSSTAAYLYASINKMTDIKVEKTTASSAETLATKYLSLSRKTGIVTASAKQTDGTYKVTVGDVTFEKLTSSYADMLGRNVTVLYKAKNAVYGINTADAVVATVDGGDYPYVWKSNSNPDGYERDTTPVYWVNGVNTAEKDITNKTIVAGSIVELINNDADAQIDTIRVVNKTVATLTADPKVVTSKDGKTTTVTVAGKEYKSTEVTGYEDLKKGDVVLYVTINGMTTFEKANAVTGLVSGISKDGVYTVNGSKLYVSELSGAKTATTDFKTEYNFFLDNGGNIVAIAVAGEAPVATEQYAVVTDFGYIGKEDNSIGGQSSVTYQAQLLFADGTSQVVEMVGYTTGKTVYGLKAADTDGDGKDDVTAFTTDIVVGKQGTNGLKQNNVGRVVSYTVKDGKYTLAEAGAAVTAGTLVGGKPNFSSADAKLAGNKNTTFLVKVGTGDKAKLNVYNGVAELPSSVTNGLTKGWAFTQDKASFANLVYLEITEIAGKTTTQTAYFLDNDAYVYTANGYEVQAIVDGEVVTLVATDNKILTAANNGLKEVVYTDGKVTAIKTLTGNKAFGTLNGVEMSSEYVEVNGKYYQVADTAIIYLLTSSKQTLVAPADLADTLDTDNYVYTAQVKFELDSDGDATDVILEMYITMEKKPANP